MGAPLHALGMMAVFVGTVIACVLSWRGRPTARRLIASLLAGLAVFLGASFSFAHLCDKGFPGMQAILWMASLTALLACVPDWKLGLLAAGLLSVFMGCLSSHYVSLIHREDFTGNPLNRENRELALKAQSARERLLQMGKKDRSTYPAGWLENAAFETGGRPMDILSPSVRVEATPLWHTFFTRLWARRTHPVALWHSGGPLSEARLEWRDQPAGEDGRRH